MYCPSLLAIDFAMHCLPATAHNTHFYWIIVENVHHQVSSKAGLVLAGPSCFCNNSQSEGQSLCTPGLFKDYGLTNVSIALLKLIFSKYTELPSAEALCWGSCSRSLVIIFQMQSLGGDYRTSFSHWQESKIIIRHIISRTEMWQMFDAMSGHGNRRYWRFSSLSEKSQCLNSKYRRNRGASFD